MVNGATSGRDRLGVIDLGSNTVLLLVLDPDGRTVCDEARITRLGQGVFETGRLRRDARARTLAAVEELARRARELGATRVVCVGTEAMRRAHNAPALVEELCMLRAGGPRLLDEVRVLTPELEAQLGIESALRARGAAARVTVVDVGGGSTEVTRAAAGGVRGVSLPLGAVRLTEAHVSEYPVPPRELAELRAAVDRELRGLERAPVGDVVAVAGTATTLGALELELEPYRPEPVEGLPLARADVERWTLRLAGLSLEACTALPGMQPGRADVMVAGLVILGHVLTALGAERFLVSGRGVRHGVGLRLLEAEGGGVW